MAARLQTSAPRAHPDHFRRWTVRGGNGIDGLRQDLAATDPLQGDQVRVRIRAVALNHRDLMVAEGRSGSPGSTLVPASDAAGEVVAVGPQVRGLAVGDRVTSSFFPDWLDGPPRAGLLERALGGSAPGVLAEQVTAAETAWVPMPAHLEFTEAATLPCAGLTAWHALFGIAPLPPAATVALLGTGGVSMFALQLARAAGHRVLVTSSDDGKLARVRALGADLTLNYRRTPDWGAEVLRLTGGVDRVLDLGGPDTIAQSLQATRVGGTVAVIGRLSGSAPARFDPAALFGGMKQLVGLMVGSRAMATDLARFTDRHALRPVIDRVFAFDEAPAAYRHLAAGGHVGKVVIAL